MGEILQCVLSHATFYIDGTLVKVVREPKKFYMIEEDVEDDITCFFDMDVNAFKAKIYVLKKPPIQLK